MVSVEELKCNLHTMEARIGVYERLEAQYFPFLSARLPLPPPREKHPPHHIWACWLQGEESAPPLVKVCLARIFERFHGYEKTLITRENMGAYITLDPVVLRKWQDGLLSDNAFANIVRLELLLRYGGVWLDATVYPTTETMPSYLEDAPLFAYSSWHWLSGDIRPVSVWLLASVPAHPILQTVRDGLVQYWQDYDALVDYFVFHMFFRMAIARYPDLWRATPRYTNVLPHLMQFELAAPYRAQRFAELCALSPFHKLTHKLPVAVREDPGNLYHHLLEEV